MQEQQQRQRQEEQKRMQNSHKTRSKPASPSIETWSHQRRNYSLQTAFDKNSMGTANNNKIPSDILELQKRTIDRENFVLQAEELDVQMKIRQRKEEEEKVKKQKQEDEKQKKNAAKNDSRRNSRLSNNSQRVFERSPSFVSSMNRRASSSSNKNSSQQQRKSSTAPLSEAEILLRSCEENEQQQQQQGENNTNIVSGKENVSTHHQSGFRTAAFALANRILTNREL